MKTRPFPRMCASVPLPLLAALLLGAVTSLAFAGEDRMHPGRIDGSQFIEMADPDGQLIEINLRGKLLRLLAGRAVKRHDENLASILADLVSIHAVIAEIDVERIGDARKRVAAITHRMREEEWERFVRVRDQGEEFTAYVHLGREDEIDGLVVMGFVEGNELLFVNLAGRVDMERIVILSERLGVPGLDDLPTTFEIDERRKTRKKRRAPGAAS